MFEITKFRIGDKLKWVDGSFYIIWEVIGFSKDQDGFQFYNSNVLKSNYPTVPKENDIKVLINSSMAEDSTIIRSFVFKKCEKCLK